jgi:hypothetical protein
MNKLILILIPDPFTQHFECDLDEKLASSLHEAEAWSKGEIEVRHDSV